MNLMPLLGAPPVIQLHMAAAILSLGLAAVQFARGRSDGPHRTIGWAFVLMMTATALTSFWIVGKSGAYSWIHMLSVITLANLLIAVLARRRGNIRLHKWTMIGVVGGLVGAGAFTLLPGRILGRVVFGG